MKKTISILFIVSVFFFILSFSIATPFFSKSFYYNQIEKLEIEETSGYSEEEIMEAYSDVYDYLVKGKEFKTGTLRYSQEGKSHFEDCKKLVQLDFIVLGISAFIIILIIILKTLKKIELYKFKKLSCFSYSGFVLLIFVSFVGVCALIDFEMVFTIFHKIFFHGKDNWMFDPSKDQIINILPADFFASCAILIGSVMVFMSLSGIIYGLIVRKKEVN